MIIKGSTKLLHFVGLICLLSAINCYSQQKRIIINKLNTEQGLATNFILDFVIDSSGFVWAASTDGLNRFDGKHVKQYKFDREDSTSIPSNKVKSLLIDNDGLLWIGTDRGLCKYIPEYDNFKSYTEHFHPLLSTKDNSSLFLYKSNILLIHQSEGLVVFDTHREKILHAINYKIDLQLEGSVVLELIDSKNRLWLIDDKTITCLQISKDEIIKICHFTENFRLNIPFSSFPGTVIENRKKEIFISNNGLFKLVEPRPGKFKFEYIDVFKHPHPKTDLDFRINNVNVDMKDRIWISTRNHGLIIYDEEKKLTRQFNAPEYFRTNDIHCTYIDAFSNKWVFSRDKRLYLFQEDKLNFYEVSSEDNYQLSLSEFELLFGDQIFTDRSGITWVNTVISGLNYFDLNKANFEWYKQNDKNPGNGILSNRPWAIYEDISGRLWIGGDGLTMYDPAEEKINQFHENKISGLKYLNNTVTAIFEVAKNEFLIDLGGRLGWLRYENGILHILNDYIPDGNNPNSLASWKPTYIIQDTDDLIWIASANGLSSWKMPDKPDDKGVFTKYYHDPENPNSIAHNRIWHLLEGTNRKIFVCSETAVSCIDKEKGIISKILPVIGSDTLYNYTPRCILEHPSKIFWIACEGYGLIKFDQLQNTYKHYIQKHGFPSDNLLSVVKDEQGNLWLSSNNEGLIRFNPITEKTDVFNESDGLQGNEFVAGSFNKGQKTGKIYFGGTNGVNAFRPDEIEMSQFKPNIVFSELQIFGKTIKPGMELNNRVVLNNNINYTDEIVLKHNENIFSVSFSAIHYSAPNKIKYEVFLEGLDEFPQILNNDENRVNYTGLGAGNYTLNVRSTNSDGVWFDNSRRLKITIRPPWYNSILAYIGYLVLLFLGILLFRRILLLKIVYEKKAEIAQIKFDQQKILLEKEKEVEKNKSRFFMNISHEFRTPLTLILDPIENTLRSQHLHQSLKQNAELIQRNSKRLLSLVNQLLDSRRLENGFMKLNVSEGNLLDFLQSVKHSFIHLANRHGIKYTLNFEDDNNIRTEHCYELSQAWYDQEKLEKIMYNLISNAFKYTPDGGSIKVIIWTKKNGKDDTQVIISVVDSGIGIPEHHLNHIFDRFYRIDNNNEGSGIGLSLTKELVELHHGELTVRSSVNNGSEFSFYLPISSQAYSFEEKLANKNEQIGNKLFIEDDHSHIENNYNEISPAENTEINQEKNLPLVLIIDDNLDILNYLSENLKDENKLILAANGKEGINLAIKKIPDIIISDVMMPFADGMKLCYALKNNTLTSHIPIIMLTALTSAEHQLEGFDAGADDYITKPFSIRMIKHKIRNILGTRTKLIKKIRGDSVEKSEISLPNEMDQQFINNAISSIEKHLSDELFCVDQLSKEMNLSRRQLYRKIKALLDQPVNQFIKEVKLQKSSDLLRTGKYNVTEVAVLTGFKNHSTFTKNFKAKFGKLPSEIMK